MSWSAVRTVAVLELRQRVRSTRWRVMLVVWDIILVLLCGGMASLASMNGDSVDEITPPLYDTMLCFVLGIGLIVAPTLSATSINGDRADATLALLQATTLRSQEIVVGKLVAAWSAALAFLAVSLPFLLVLTLAGGASWTALLGHMLILVVFLGAICAIGLGFSAAAARTSASAVLTYLAVAALVIGTPLATAISATAVQGEQTRIIYTTNYDASTNDRQVCKSQPQMYTEDIVHTERIWWMLIPNPFVALADVSARAPTTSTYPYAPGPPLEGMGAAVDDMRDSQPAEIIENHCEEDSGSPLISGDDSYEPDIAHLVFWPVSLIVVLGLGAWSLTSASQRLRTPVRGLARGTRVA